MGDLETVLKRHVLEATKKAEEDLDAELNRLDNLDLDDLRSLREKRLKELKKEEQDKQEWLSKGHGEYTELTIEKEFFEVCKKSTNVIVVFFKNSSPRCSILDHHMKILCKKHLEAKIVKINVERAPFLTDRLGIRIIPTMALIKDEKAVDYIVGFTELGNCDDFSTEMLEWRIAQSGVFRYSGDLTVPPAQKKVSRQFIYKDKKKTIRDRNKGDSDDDFDDE